MTRNPTAAGSSCSARRASVTREAYLEDAIGAYILYQQELERKMRLATVSTTGLIRFVASLNLLLNYTACCNDVPMSKHAQI